MHCKSRLNHSDCELREGIGARIGSASEYRRHRHKQKRPALAGRFLQASSYAVNAGRAIVWAWTQNTRPDRRFADRSK